MIDKNCSVCGHVIDSSAKLCPYCGADPVTGHKVDVKPIVQEHFPPRRRVSLIDRGMGLIRQRQGIVVTAIIVGSLLLLGALHRFAQSRNESVSADIPAVPLTEITDLSQRDRNAELPIPDLPFSYDGNPKTMQTFLVEPGAVIPAAPAPAAPPPGTPVAAGATAPAVRPGVAPVKPR